MIVLGLISFNSEQFFAIKIDFFSSVEELDFKRSVYLLIGLILTILGTALAITDGILGIDNGSGAADVGVLTETWFFVILGVALASLIIGLFKLD